MVAQGSCPTDEPVASADRARMPPKRKRKSMRYEFIEVSTSDHVTTVTINRPQVMNALHPYAAREMDAAFDAFQADDDQWVAILTGAGDLFAGAFLWGLAEGYDPETCARMGNIAASEIIVHIGARPEADLRELFISAGVLQHH